MDSTNSFFIILFILTLAFSLTSSGIFNGNMSLGIIIDAHATRFNGPQEESMAAEAITV